MMRNCREQESGQILVILALAMIGLLVAAGLAVDGGVLLMRKAQLDRAVDSAALAGVTELAEVGETGAHDRGRQLLAANGIETSTLPSGPVPSGGPCPDEDWDYCGYTEPGLLLGAYRYHVEVRFEAEVYFMSLLGFTSIPLHADAEAEYFPNVDIYASGTQETGILKGSNQSIFGPDICPGYGDPYTPTNYPGGADNPNWDELEGAYTYRILIPESYPHDEVRIEIFDPDSANQAGSTFTAWARNGATQNGTCAERRNTCTIPTGEADDENPLWFVRVDENRGTSTPGTCGQPGSYNEAYNTNTMYRVFYFQQQPDGTLTQVDLAYYIGKAGGAEAAATDLHWVAPVRPGGEGQLLPSFTALELGEYLDLAGYPDTQPEPGPAQGVTAEDCETYRAAHFGDDPTLGQYTTAETCTGNGDFIVNLTSDVDNIYTDPGTGARFLYFQVRGLDGGTENGYELWAGPPASEMPVPSQVNERNMYIMNNGLETHSSDGVGIYGLGHLPMNSNVGRVVDIPLTYLGPQFAGQTVFIDMFDPDAGAQAPIVFYFDTIPVRFESDTSTVIVAADLDPYPWRFTSGIPCSVDGTGAWVSEPACRGSAYQIDIPSEESHPDRQHFYGGRLIARYRAGKDDTYGWKITISSRPYLVE